MFSLLLLAMMGSFLGMGGSGLAWMLILSRAKQGATGIGGAGLVGVCPSVGADLGLGKAVLL